MRFPGWVTGALVLTVTLGAGVVLGTHLERRRHPASSVSAILPMEHMRRFLLDELDLDSAQDQAVGAILDRHQAGVDSAWRGLHPRLMATLDSSLREVAALLRPDQLERFRKLIRERHPGVLQ